MKEATTTMSLLEMFEVPTWQDLRKAVEKVTTETKQYTKAQNVKLAEIKIEVNYNKVLTEEKDTAELEELSKLYNFDVIKACEKVTRQKELYEEMWNEQHEIDRHKSRMEFYENQHQHYNASLMRQGYYEHLAKFEALKREFINNKYYA